MIIRLIIINSSWQRSKLFLCSFVFLGMMDRLGFTFRSSDLNDSTKFLNNYVDLRDIPLVLEWRIGPKNCSKMLKSDRYACKENSYCVDI